MKGSARKRKTTSGGGRFDGQNLAVAVTTGGRIHHMGEVEAAGFVAAELGQFTPVCGTAHA